MDIPRWTEFANLDMNELDIQEDLHVYLELLELKLSLNWKRTDNV